jgi:hypothetical protein
MHRDVEANDNTNNPPNHIVGPVRCQAKKTNCPRIVQSGQSTVKNLLTIVDMISPVWRSNIGSAHPCRLTME